MINLFIDTNVWLSLYDFSKNVLEEFEKIKVNKKYVRLVITEQVVDEFWRNREDKINQILKRFEYKKFQFPNVIKPYSEYIDLRKKQSDLVRLFEDLKKKVEDDLYDVNTEVDKIIDEFFLESVDIEENILTLAKERFDKGNPPGKNGSYGDAINWEYLLQKIPKGEDIYIVSDDKDYQSPLSKGKINLFLKKEWEKKKESQIYFYMDLANFFSDNLKDIKLKEKEEKEKNIFKLSNSKSYSETHSIISELSKFSKWDEEEIIELCNIFFENSQVRDILNDSDIKEFYRILLTNCSNSKILRENAEVLRVFKYKVKNIIKLIIHNEYYNEMDFSFFCDKIKELSEFLKWGFLKWDEEEIIELCNFFLKYINNNNELEEEIVQFYKVILENYKESEILKNEEKIIGVLKKLKEIQK